MDRLEELGASGLLQDDAGRAAIEGEPHRARRHARGQHQYPRGAAPVEQELQQVGAGVIAEIVVQQDQVEQRIRQDAAGLGEGGAVCDHLQRRLLGQAAHQALAQQGVVVDQQDADRFGHAGSSWATGSSTTKHAWPGSARYRRSPPKERAKARDR